MCEINDDEYGNDIGPIERSILNRIRRSKKSKIPEKGTLVAKNEPYQNFKRNTGNTRVAPLDIDHTKKYLEDYSDEPGSGKRED